MRFFNKLGNVAFSQLFTYLLQQPIKDTLCGTKVLWRKDYERIAAARSYFGDFDPFGDFDLIFGAARLGLKIAELPVRYRDRSYGETNIQRWKQFESLLTRLEQSGDRATEGERERALMSAVRSGAVDPDRLDAALLPFPVKIQIQTVSPCNAACVMCPWPATKDVLPQGSMADAVYERVVGQLAGRGVERTSLFLMNEPTLDRRLARRTAHLKRVVPETTALIFTNGLLLTADFAECLNRTAAIGAAVAAVP